MCIYDAAVEFNVVEMRRIFCIKLKRPKRFHQLTVFNQNIIKRDGHLTLLYHLHFFLVCFLSPRQISVIGYSFSLWPRKVTRIEIMMWSESDQKVSNNTAYPWFIVTKVDLIINILENLDSLKYLWSSSLRLCQ